MRPLFSRSSPIGGRHAERGSTLLLVIVIVALMGIIGLGIITRSSSETGSVAAKRHYDQSVTCADAAREMLLSKFSTYGVSAPEELTLLSQIDGKTMMSGHYEEGEAPTVTVTRSVEESAGAAQASFGVSDISNRIGRVALGGQVFRMTVVCRGSVPPGGGAPRVNEVEYLVRFGL